jgi:hypothetical protein
MYVYVISSVEAPCSHVYSSKKGAYRHLSEQINIENYSIAEYTDDYHNVNQLSVTYENFCKRIKEQGYVVIYPKWISYPDEDGRVEVDQKIVRR